MKYSSLFVCLVGGVALAGDDPGKRITEANAVFNEIMASPGKRIPKICRRRRIAP